MAKIDDIAAREAREFIEQEGQFHLGFLPTEQSHPKTVDFSATVLRDSAAGAAMLLSVDLDIPPVAERIFAGLEFAALERAVEETARRAGQPGGGGRIAFTGCGATGRLAIILEKMWRAYWEEAAERYHSLAWQFRGRAEAAYSIMTGGDRALIRSVENFEDYISFGRRQVVDARLGKGDVLIAITEGGETSSVIGTALEACERGARVFFVFNNPTSVLREHIERSRRIIEEPRITKIDLFTGPMALSGSTRLQATTSEMLVVGAALERACARVLAREVPSEGGAEAGSDRLAQAPDASAYAGLFERLVRSLSSGEALEGVARAMDLESDVYRGAGLVTYLCDEYLLDIISDTTERTPTFMLPPFRARGDESSPPSWAFTKDPLLPTGKAWHRMLRREPRGLDWNAEDYRAMGASERIISRPPKLDRAEILSYAIGVEDDPSRSAQPGSLLLLVDVGEPSAPPVERSFERLGQSFPRRSRLSIGRASGGSGAEAIDIPVDIPPTPMGLMTHLAVKLIFNTVSTATMGKLGRIQGNWMIQVDPTNKKLVDRSTRIIAALAGLPYEDACRELYRSIVERREGPKQYQDSCVASTLKRLGAFR